MLAILCPIHRRHKYFWPGQVIPQHCQLPVESPMDETKCVAEHLIQAIQKLRQDNNCFPGWHTDALEKLSTMFKGATTDIRCNASEPNPTSHDPTNPNEIHQAPRTHNHVTRNNIPSILPRKRQRKDDALPNSESGPQKPIQRTNTKIFRGCEHEEEDAKIQGRGCYGWWRREPWTSKMLTTIEPSACTSNPNHSKTSLLKPRVQIVNPIVIPRKPYTCHNDRMAPDTS